MNVPELRFPEFSGEWEEKKLLELTHSISSGKTKSKSIDEFTNQRLIDDGNCGKTKSKSIDEKGQYNIYGSVGVIGFTNNPDYEGKFVLIARVGANAGKTNLINEKCGISDNTLIIKYKNEIIPEFSFYHLENYNLNRLIFGSGQPLITGNQLKNISFKIPKFNEQEKIASSLSKVDEKIEKLEKKQELWETYKKGMMQKIFSKELRFKDESGEDYSNWEEKKLDSISKLTSSKRVYLADYTKIGIPFYRGKEINNLRNGEPIEDLLYISEPKYNEFKEKFGVPKKNDILITAVGTLGNVYRVTNNEPFYFKDGNLIWLKKVKENSYFLEYALEYNKKTILNSSIGSTQKALTIVELNKVKINIPSIPEQTKIANLLSAIDKKIKNIEKELELNKEFKKGLLQKMFC